MKAGKIESIQLMRALAAVAIIIRHTYIGRGNFGVELLFIISGFVLMLSTEIRKNHFLLRRVIRIVPLYWMASFLCWFGVLLKGYIIVSNETITWLIKSLFFIPYDTYYECSIPLSPVCAVGWTINYEIAFYLAFCLAMTISHKNRGIWAIAISLFCSMAAYLFNHDSDMYIWMIEICSGVLIYSFMRYAQRKVADATSQEKIKKQSLIVKSRMAIVTCYVTVIALIIVSFWAIAPRKVDRLFLYWLPSLLIFILLLVLLIDVPIPKWIVMIGNMSYSIYLVEWFTTSILNTFFIGHRDMSYGFSIVLVVFAIIVTLIISWFSYQLVEKGLTSFLMKKLKLI